MDSLQQGDTDDQHNGAAGGDIDDDGGRTHYYGDGCADEHGRTSHDAARVAKLVEQFDVAVHDHASLDGGTYDCAACNIATEDRGARDNGYIHGYAFGVLGAFDIVLIRPEHGYYRADDVFQHLDGYRSELD